MRPLDGDGGLAGSSCFTTGVAAYGISEAAHDPTIGSLVVGRDLSATLHVVTSDRRLFTGARAVLSAGRLVPRWRLLAMAFDHRLGHVVLEPIYRGIASHRRQGSRMLRIPAFCPIPSPAERPR